MALDRWIAVIFLAICLAYGYTAFFLMDGSLPPFMQRNPIWPSTFPKILSVLGVICALAVIFNSAKDEGPKEGEIDYRRLLDYKVGQALVLVGLMVAYAYALRPIGFVPSTVLFLLLGFYALGERRWLPMILSSFIAAGFVWYLVQEVLGIFLRPLPIWFGV